MSTVEKSKLSTAVLNAKMADSPDIASTPASMSVILLFFHVSHIQRKIWNEHNILMRRNNAVCVTTKDNSWYIEYLKEHYLHLSFLGYHYLTEKKYDLKIFVATFLDNSLSSTNTVHFFIEKW